MKKATIEPKGTPMRPEYNFSGRVRGKYAAAYLGGTSVVLVRQEKESEKRVK